MIKNKEGEKRKSLILSETLEKGSDYEIAALKYEMDMLEIREEKPKKRKMISSIFA